MHYQSSNKSGLWTIKLSLLLNVDFVANRVKDRFTYISQLKCMKMTIV